MAKYNRTEQLARFLRDRGEFMSAHEIKAAGFLLEGDIETGLTAIICLINNIRQSSRFGIKRQFKSEMGGKHNKILVVSIDGKKSDSAEPVARASASQLWHSLLSGHRSAMPELSE